MKRILICGIVLLLVAGCGKKYTVEDVVNNKSFKFITNSKEYNLKCSKEVEKKTTTISVYFNNDRKTVIFNVKGSSKYDGDITITDKINTFDNAYSLLNSDGYKCEIVEDDNEWLQKRIEEQERLKKALAKSSAKSSFNYKEAGKLLCNKYNGITDNSFTIKNETFYYNKSKWSNIKYECSEQYIFSFNKKGKTKHVNYWLMCPNDAKRNEYMQIATIDDSIDNFQKVYEKYTSNDFVCEY